MGFSHHKSAPNEMIESLWQLPASKTIYTQPLIEQSITYKLFMPFHAIYRKELLRPVARGVGYDVSKWEHGHWSICKRQLRFQELPTDRCNEKEIFSSDPLMGLIVDHTHSGKYFRVLLGIGSNQFVAILSRTLSIQGWFRHATLCDVLDRKSKVSWVSSTEAPIRKKEVSAHASALTFDWWVGMTMYKQLLWRNK